MRDRGQTRAWSVIASVLLGVAPGCVTTYNVGRAPSAASIASINEAGRGLDLEVQYRGIALAPPPLGAARRSLVETGNASIARADATTVTFVKRDGSEQPVPTKLIRTVSVTRRGPAAVYGALIGFGVGAAITAVALLAAQPCEGAQGVCLPTDDMIAPLAFSAGLIGALLGGGFAALVGQQTTYVFDETP